MKSFKGMAALCLATALLAGVAAGFGVFARGDGSVATTTSIRGETYDYATTGVYAYNSERVVAEGVGWDIFTLFAAVPAMLLALPAVARGSLKGRLFAMGILGYFFYQYLMYAMTWALGPLLPLFIVVYAASAATIVWIVSTVPLAAVAEGFSAGFPRKGVAALCFLMAAILVAMWSQRIAAGLGGDVSVLQGSTTLVVQALDLGLIVPLSVATGALALMRRPVGYLLSTVFLVKAVAMAAAICAMLVSAALVEGVVDWGGLAIFGSACAASVWLAWRIYRPSMPEAGTEVGAARA